MTSVHFRMHGLIRKSAKVAKWCHFNEILHFYFAIATGVARLAQFRVSKLHKLTLKLKCNFKCKRYFVKMVDFIHHFFHLSSRTSIDFRPHSLKSRIGVHFKSHGLKLKSVKFVKYHHFNKIFVVCCHVLIQGCSISALVPSNNDINF